MAVTRGATLSSRVRTNTGTDANISSHEVDANTTLLVVSTFYEAAETVTQSVLWRAAGGDETLTLVDETTRSGQAADVCVSTFALVSPSIETANIRITHSENDNSISVATNYIGTKTTSVADAIQLLTEDVNNEAGETNTTVFGSAGTSGNALYTAASCKGGDADPSSNANSFFEIYDAASGTGATTDIAAYVTDLLNSAPSAFTGTWAVTDSNAGHYLEIVAVAAAANPKGPLGHPLYGPFRGPIG